VISSYIKASFPSIVPNSLKGSKYSVFPSARMRLKNSFLSRSLAVAWAFSSNDSLIFFFYSISVYLRCTVVVTFFIFIDFAVSSSPESESNGSFSFVFTPGEKLTLYPFFKDEPSYSAFLSCSSVSVLLPLKRVISSDNFICHSE
jgi:hypothetical protein